MFTIEFSSKAKKQISKLAETDQKAIKTYLEEKVAKVKDKKDLYNASRAALVGNLKGFWRFKHSEFRKYRIISYLGNKKLIITVLAVESRSDSYKIRKNLQDRQEKNFLTIKPNTLLQR